MFFGAGFVFPRIPEIHFGVGKLAQLPGLVRARGDALLLVTGSASFRGSAHFAALEK